MDDKAKGLLDTIQTKKISPTPKIYFILKNILFWSICIISMVLVAIIASIFFYRIVQLYQYNPRFIHISIWGRILAKTIRIIWALLLIGSVYMIIYSIRHTRRGYRYPTTLLIAVCFGLVTCLFITYHIIGISPSVLKQLEGRKLISNPAQIDYEIWNNPEDGLLLGIVSEVHEDYFKLVVPSLSPNSMKSKEYNPSRVHFKQENLRNKKKEIVDIAHTTWKINTSETTKIHPMLEDLHPDIMIKIKGKKITDFEFMADSLLPAKRISKTTLSDFCLDTHSDTKKIRACKQKLLKQMRPFRPHHNSYDNNNKK